MCVEKAGRHADNGFAEDDDHEEAHAFGKRFGDDEAHGRDVMGRQRGERNPDGHEKGRRTARSRSATLYWPTPIRP